MQTIAGECKRRLLQEKRNVCRFFVRLSRRPSAAMNPPVIGDFNAPPVRWLLPSENPSENEPACVGSAFRSLRGLLSIIQFSWSF